MCSVVKGNKHTDFRSSIQESFPLRIGLHRAHVGPVGNAGYDWCPRLAEVARLVNVWLRIVQTMSIYRYVGAARVVRRRVDDANRAPLRNFSGDIGPMRAVIGRDVNQTIIGA